MVLNFVISYAILVPLKNINAILGSCFGKNIVKTALGRCIMRIKFLGTGASEGIPAMFCKCDVCENARKLLGKEVRTRTSVLVDGCVLIDFPPDTFYHAFINGEDLSAVHSALITHSHSDHFYPFDLMTRVASSSIKRTEEVLTLYLNAEAQKKLGCAIDKNIIEELVDNTKTKEIHAGDKLELKGGYKVTALPADHVPSEECLTYLIEKGDKRYLHVTDSTVPPESFFEALKGKRVDAVLLDCTFGTLKGNQYGHMTVDDNVEVKRRLTEIGAADDKTVFVAGHIAHCCGLGHEELNAELNKFGITVAYDGMCLEI